MGYKWEILIPFIEKDEQSKLSLTFELNKQIKRLGLSDLVQVISKRDLIGNRGVIRNDLLFGCDAEYLSFFDADDVPSKDYVELNMEGIFKGVDCVSLRGIYTVNGDPEHPEAGIFEHSIKYDEYRTNHTGVPKYERFPNHLNAIKASIAKQFKFPEINHGEDTDWAHQIKRSGLIKTEYYVDAVTYHYQYVTNK